MKKLLLVMVSLLMLFSAVSAKENDEYSGKVMLYTSAGEDVARSFKQVFELSGTKRPSVEQRKGLRQGG